MSVLQYIFSTSYLNLHKRSPISNLTFIDFFDHFRFHFEVPVNIHQAIDLLLYIADLRIAEAAAIWNLLHCCCDIIKTSDEIFFGIYLISISPS